MAEPEDREDDEDDLGRLSLGFRILFVLGFAWLMLSYQMINPGVQQAYPWSDYFVVGPAPVLIVFALYGIWTTLRKN